MSRHSRGRREEAEIEQSGASPTESYTLDEPRLRGVVGSPLRILAILANTVFWRQ